MTAELSEDARRIAVEGIRARHPEYDARQVRAVLFVLLLGDELARRVTSRAPADLP